MPLEWPGRQSFGPVHVFPGARGARYPDGQVVCVDGGVPTVLDPMSRPVCTALAAAVSVRQIFNSHFHEDHRQGNDLFPDAALWVPAGERAGYAGMAGFAHLYGVAPDVAERWADSWPEEYPGMRRTDVAGTFAFGDTFTWGEVRVEIVGLPGHSPGHSGFFFPEHRVLYVGDVDLTKFGPWYGSRCSDLDAFLETLYVLDAYADRVDAFITAHERGVVRGDLRREVGAYRAVIRARDHRLLGLLSARPRTWAELVREEIVYFYPAKERSWVQHDDRVMIRHHLDRLLAAGIVVADGDWFALSGDKCPAAVGGESVVGPREPC